MAVTVIISGGSVDVSFVRNYINNLKDDAVTFIAADRGVDACEKLGITPSFIIGDFDSLVGQSFASQASATSKTLVEEGNLDSVDSKADVVLPEDLPDILKKYAGSSEIIRLSPLKDDTDTEAAIRLAIERTVGNILVFGATGTRLDHVLGNIGLLHIGLEHNRNISLLDSHNRIRLVKDRLTLYKKGNPYKYVSFIPFMGKAEGVSLSGFKYEVKNTRLDGFSTLGISNEIREDEACVLVEQGMLICVESRD